MTHKIVIGQEWYKSQDRVFNREERFIVLVCGRRWGKTRGALQWLFSKAVCNKKSLCWWISPTYRQSKIAIKYLLALYPNSKYGFISSFNKSELKITLLNGSDIEFKSADSPDHLEGEGINYLVIDEAGIVLKDEMLWHRSLRPMISDTKGQVVFVGTPKGTSLFKEFYNWGKDDNKKDWISFNMPSYEGHMKKFPEEIEEMKRQLPEYIFRQEIEGQFLNNDAIFKNIEEICQYKTEEYNEKNHYLAGIDLAKYSDYTVISIGYGNKCVYIEKLGHMDWSLQIEKIKHLLSKYNVQMAYVDATGVGDVITEAMQSLEINVEPIKFSNESKNNIINNLILLFERKQINIVNNPELINELKNFEIKLNSQGKMRFQGAPGHHDDYVISLALLFWGLKEEKYETTPLIEALGQNRKSKEYPGFI